MAKGNQGFADLVSGAGAASRPAARLPPRTGILGERQNRLAELASGATVTRIQEYVDPARCRIWPGHNRDYAALNAENCADLIESMRAQGRQEVPAIVRRVTDDPDHAFEVICGARRHWTVSWLRANSFPDFRFLIEPRELTDEEAFRLADLENRNRRDLSDYERATDYARAIDRYYGGSQQRMAERLEVSKSWLSRYLELARLPGELVAAFGSPHVLGISHGAALAPLLRLPAKRDRLLAAAADVAAEQVRLAASGAPMLKPGIVLRRVLAAAEPPRLKPSRANREHVVRDSDGAVIARGQRPPRGAGLAITVPLPSRHARPELLAAFAEILDQMGADG